jgi:hypothetical protein
VPAEKLMAGDDRDEKVEFRLLEHSFLQLASQQKRARLQEGPSNSVWPTPPSATIIGSGQN